jgi:pimeloyl-ACP methyl ester carboxylesterase
VTEYTVPLEGVSIHCREWETDGPPVLFLHHTTGNSLHWSAVASRIARDFRAIAIDLRGHGGSSKPAAGYSWAEDYARDVGQFLERQLHEPAVLVGFSLGAMVSVPVAVRMPERVRGLVLEDPPAFPSSNASPEIYAFFGERLSLRRLPLHDRIRCLVEQGQDREEAERSADGMETWCEEVLAEYISGGTTYSSEEWFPQVRCPALVIVGNPERGSVVTLEHRALLSELVPGSRLVTCEASGHAPHEDEFERFLEALGAFLSEVYSG